MNVECNHIIRNNQKSIRKCKTVATYRKAGTHTGLNAKLIHYLFFTSQRSRSENKIINFKQNTLYGKVNEIPYTTTTEKKH